MITETTNNTKQDAKHAYLDNQRFRVIERLKATDKAERAATIRHIDCILSASLSPEQTEFWQSVQSDIFAIDGKD